MDVQFLSLIYFTIITILYFSYPNIGKPSITVGELQSEEGKQASYSKYLRSLAFYLAVVIVIQFFTNMTYLISTCSASLNKNIGLAALFTFIPWLLIFGVMIAVLIVYPGFKTAYANILGYFSISMQANELLGTILIDKDVNRAIANETNEVTKQKIIDSSDALTKIFGNKSIIINEMSPYNFLEFWSILEPLMKPQYVKDTQVQQELLDLIVRKDNVGEAFWYICAAIIINSFLYANLAKRGCVKSVEQTKAERDEYLAQQAEIDKQNQLNNSVVYQSN